MAKKQSSSRLSTIASRVLKTCAYWSAEGCKEAALNIRDVKALAASVLSQDETKGQKRKTKKKSKKLKFTRAEKELARKKSSPNRGW